MMIGLQAVFSRLQITSNKLAALERRLQQPISAAAHAMQLGAGAGFAGPAAVGPGPTRSSPGVARAPARDFADAPLQPAAAAHHAELASHAYASIISRASGAAAVAATSGNPFAVVRAAAATGSGAGASAAIIARAAAAAAAQGRTLTPPPSSSSLGYGRRPPRASAAVAIARLQALQAAEADDDLEGQLVAARPMRDLEKGNGLAPAGLGAASGPGAGAGSFLKQPLASVNTRALRSSVHVSAEPQAALGPAGGAGAPALGYDPAAAAAATAFASSGGPPRSSGPAGHVLSPASAGGPRGGGDVGSAGPTSERSLPGSAVSVLKDWIMVRARYCDARSIDFVVVDIYSKIICSRAMSTGTL